MTLFPKLCREVEKLVRDRYLESSEDENEKILEGLKTFTVHLQLRKNNEKGMILEAAKTIHRIFPFEEVCIGLRSPIDGMYKYELVMGYTREAEEAFKKFAYSKEDMFNPTKFPAIMISKQIRLLLTENQPSQEFEKDCWNRPSMLPMERKSADDFVEGDYMDIYMFGTSIDPIGWIELSAPRDRKMPSASVLKGLEVFASILAIGLQNARDNSRDSRNRY